MAKRAKKSAKSKGKTAVKVPEYVTVALARSEEEAKNYEALLKSDDIPAVVREQKPDDYDTGGFAVMVPEEYADEAYVVVESHDAYDDFYDMSVDEEEDFDDDILNDNY